ncbi:MAG TPA: glycosyltransferase, partial [Anaerolineae bacterium]|nr:glycosyltransferase [Anaerolineae bacterium]
MRNDRRQGMIHGVNRAISEMATGEFIAIQHSDDLWEPGKLAAQVGFLEAHPGHGAVFTGVRAIDEHGNPLADRSHFYFSIFDQPQRNRHEWLRFFFLRGNALCHPSVLIQKGFFDQYGLYRHGFSQLTDYDTWIRLCLHREIHVLPERLVQFRVREGEANTSSPTRQHAIRTHYERLRALENFRELSQFEELALVLPETRKYQRPGASDAMFALGMYAVEARADRQTVLFGMELLFEALNDAHRAGKLKKVYGFDDLRYRELTTSLELFLDYAPSQIEIMVARRLDRLLRLARAWLAPPGTRRRKTLSAIVDRVRARWKA